MLTTDKLIALPLAHARWVITKAEFGAGYAGEVATVADSSSVNPFGARP